MTGVVRNLFGTYQIYDTPDYEDLAPKLLCVEKYAVYFSSGWAVIDLLKEQKPPKGVLAISKQVLKFLVPATVTSAAFVGTLYASAHLRGKKNDQWNSFFATLTSGALLTKIVGGPWTFLNYFCFVGLATNMYKFAKMNNFDVANEDAQMKRRQESYLFGPFLTDWTVYNPKDYPPKWINGDESDAKGRVVDLGQ